jgi:hypothetical protein
MASGSRKVTQRPSRLRTRENASCIHNFCGFTLEIDFMFALARRTGTRLTIQCGGPLQQAKKANCQLLCEPPRSEILLAIDCLFGLAWLVSETLRRSWPWLQETILSRPACLLPCISSTALIALLRYRYQLPSLAPLF